MVSVSEEPLSTLSTLALSELVRMLPEMEGSASSATVTLPVRAVKSSLTSSTVMVSVEVVVLPLSSVTV